MTVQFISPYLRPILLLIGSNIFMTLAWYGHLRFKQTSLILVIVVAWLIAFIEGGKDQQAPETHESPPM
jgi:uncharacterized protein